MRPGCIGRGKVYYPPMLDAIIALDRAAAAAINGLSNTQLLDWIMALVTWGGNGAIAFFLTIPFYPQRPRRAYLRAAAACAVALAIGGLVVQGIKHAVPRARPAADPALAGRINDLTGGLKSGSFPSGHAQTAFGAATVVALEAGALWGGTAFALASLVAFSRIYLGAHFPADVAAGAVLGIVTALLCVYSARRLFPPRESGDGH